MSVRGERSKQRKKERKGFFRFGFYQLICPIPSLLRLMYMIMTPREIPDLMRWLFIGWISTSMQPMFPRSKTEIETETKVTQASILSVREDRKYVEL